MRRFGYDAAHRLVTIDGLVGRTTVTSDAAGRRTSERRPDGSMTRYSWDGSGRLARVRHPDGTDVAFDVDAAGELRAVGPYALAWDPTCAVPQLRSVDGVPVVGADTPLATPAGPLAPDVHGDLGPRDPWGVPASSRPQLGYRGELEAAGLVWLRHRAYDPATASFLSPDPLPPVLGGPVNPFGYAGGDPIGNRDPLGLTPVSDADVALMSQADDRSWLGDAWGWVVDHGDEIAAGALAVGAVALIATGAGAPIGAGILIGMGVSAGVQALTTGEVDARGLWVSGLAGGLSAGVGASVAGAGGGFLAQGAAGVGTGAVSSVGSQAIVTGRVDPGQVLLDSAVGGLGGVAGPAIGRLRGGAGVIEPAAGAASRGAPMDSLLPGGATVRHNTTATAIGDDTATQLNFSRSVGANGRHDVIVHGTVRGEPLVNGNVTHPQQIADAVLENPAYRRNPITLVMCHGGRNVAPYLSRRLGVDVYATTRQAQLDPVTGELVQGGF